jgi:dTDP-L-rhamnose 4-epimerase
MSQVLVTGGAGFIGSHLVDALVARGHQVRVLDAILEQVHGSRPRPLPAGVEVVHGDVRDRRTVDRALVGVEVVFHKAAVVGVGQSMREIELYVSTNTLGTATLLEALVERRGQVRKLVVPSSVSVYGEGAYRCPRCGPAAPAPRDAARLAAGEWEMRCPACASTLAPEPTPETRPFDPASVYAITKQDQEQLCLVTGRAYGIPTVALRYFNIYGPRQALSNPYTGVAAIFAAQLMRGEAPQVYEDGLQTRDFTHVADVVQANLLAMETDRADFQALNVGTGSGTSIARLAELLAQGLGVRIPPVITGRCREGDIRHSVADITRARRLLGYRPSVSLEQGVADLITWAREEVSGISDCGFRIAE